MTAGNENPNCPEKYRAWPLSPSEPPVRSSEIVRRKTLAQAITQSQRQIFELRKTYKIGSRCQAMLDEARETLHFAKIEAEWDAPNTRLTDGENQNQTTR